MKLIQELQSANPNNERILELLADENVSYTDKNSRTTLMVAFQYYAENPNCNNRILLKMLAFEFYGKNPNCDPIIFSKMLDMNCYPEQVNNNR
jgi:hypothetical protein